jgi:hypothetical protein
MSVVASGEEEDELLPLSLMLHVVSSDDADDDGVAADAVAGALVLVS